MGMMCSTRLPSFALWSCSEQQIPFTQTLSGGESKAWQTFTVGAEGPMSFHVGCLGGIWQLCLARRVVLLGVSLMQEEGEGRIFGWWASSLGALSDSALLGTHSVSSGFEWVRRELGGFTESLGQWFLGLKLVKFKRVERERMVLESRDPYWQKVKYKGRV